MSIMQNNIEAKKVYNGNSELDREKYHTSKIFLYIFRSSKASLRLIVSNI